MSELVNTKLSVDLPILQDITARTWGKEDELKALKSELAVLDRKITAELAPKHDEKDVEEIKRDNQTQQAQGVNVPAQSNCSKELMVAEPQPEYKVLTMLPSKSLRV